MQQPTDVVQEKAGADIVQQEETVDQLAHHVQDMSATQIGEAYRAAQTEHKMGFWKALRIYKKSMFWSAVMSFGIIMESYDTMLVGSFYAMPAFRSQFGTQLPDGSYQLTAPIQTAFSVLGTVGLMIGVHTCGWLTTRYKHRHTVIISLIIITGFIFMLFFAKNVGTLIAGEFLINIPIGFINNVAPAYAIEVAPLPLRHWGPSYVQLCWVIGHLFGSGILNIWVDSKSSWAWRIPYALQWIWPVPLIVLLTFAPDSPWQLVRLGKTEDALKSLKKLNNGEQNDHETLALIQHTIQLESSLNFQYGYKDLFKGIDLRRTEIATLIWSAQALCGFALPTGVYFFEVAGLSAKNAFILGVGQYLTVGVGTFMGMALCQKFGRRTLFFVSWIGMNICIGTIGILSLIKNQTDAVVWPQGVLILGRFFFYGLGAGILPFIYSTEIGSVGLRPKTLSFTRNIYNLLSIISGIFGTYLLNPTAWNLKGKAAWISFVFNVFILLWGYYRLPETIGRSFEELDLMFAKKVKARDFKKHVITTEEQFGITDEKAKRLAESSDPVAL